METLTDSSTNSTTIQQDLDLNVKKRIHSFSINTSGDYCALAGKHISFIDLDNPTKDEVVLKNPSQHKSLEFSLVKYHNSDPTLLAASVNAEAFIWKVDIKGNRYDMLGKTVAHRRPVSDITWSQEKILGTCSPDGYICLWDLRDLKKPVKGYKTFIAPNKMEWNRIDSNLFASTHETQVLVWDIRKDTQLEVIMAHVSSITGIDWCHDNGNHLITSSQDRQVKMWDILQPKKAIETIQIGAPVLRAKYTPFGKGIVTMAQHSEYSLTLWALNDLSAPVRSYKHHSDLFEFRNKGESELKEHQLVAMSKDQHLRLWAIDKNDRQACGDNTPTPTTLHKKRDKKTDSEFFPQDLSSEFAKIKKYGIPGVQIEKLSLATRTAIVSVEQDRKTAEIKITFPEAYPRNAAPSYEFLTSSTISIAIQTNLRKFLSETSAFQVERNRPVMEHTLGKLVLLLKNVNLKRFDTPEPSLASSLTEKWFNYQSSPTNSPKDSLPNDIIQYTVKQTDTLLGIAIQFNMKPEVLRQYNGLHTNLVVPGQVLFVNNPAVTHSGMNKHHHHQLRQRGATMNSIKVENTTKDDSGLTIPTKKDNSANYLGVSPPAPRPRSSSTLDKRRTSLLDQQRKPVEVIKETVRYCTDTFHVTGVLTLTSEFCIFEPSMQDNLVIKNGVLPYQLYLTMSDIFDCQLIRENEKYFYDTSLEISVLKDNSVKMYDFLADEKVLRFLHKKVLGWTSQDHQEQEPTATEKVPEVTDDLSLEKERSDLGQLIPRLTSISSFLTEKFIHQISIHLPARLRHYDWKLMYGTQQHGISLNTFYTKLKDQGPSILVVEDSKKRLFGGFVTESWRIEPHYYGNGESFLFSLLPEVKFYHWTGKNQFFQCSRRDFISVGGGSHFGLWLDSDFQMGSSNMCETFGNPALGSNEEFMITVVEVWGFVDK